jgi:hypothetical protein
MVQIAWYQCNNSEFQPHAEVAHSGTRLGISFVN